MKAYRCGFSKSLVASSKAVALRLIMCGALGSINSLRERERERERGNN